MVLAFEGDTVRVGVSIPVSLAGMDRYSLVQSEVTAHVQEGETGIDTAERARALMRVNFFANVTEVEQDLMVMAERQAAEQDQIDRALRGRRTN